MKCSAQRTADETSITTIGVFNVRIVRYGDRYGLDDCLTHDEQEPMVEFYDASQCVIKFGPRGQFVSRYYCSTILENEFPWGLSLDGGIPQWSVSSSGMAHVKDFINQALSTPTRNV